MGPSLPRNFFSWYASSSFCTGFNVSAIAKNMMSRFCGSLPCSFLRLVRLSDALMFLKESEAQLAG